MARGGGKEICMPNVGAFGLYWDPAITEELRWVGRMHFDFILAQKGALARKISSIEV